MMDFDVVVVGAGQAGLGVGYFLNDAGNSFVILERGRVGESWRSQRWDSFAVNTPNWMNSLPGTPYSGLEPDGFWHRDELIASFERHAKTHSLPIRTGVTVTALRKRSDGLFEVDTEDEQGTYETLTAGTVVVASGLMQTPKVPRVSESFPPSVAQIHASQYRSPATLDDGAVLVVGSGQSGCQIAEDLVLAGRDVYLCTSPVGRVPRRYRGRDILEWMQDVGMLDQTVDDLPDPMAQFAAQPQVSGVGRYGATLSLQGLQRQGVHLTGRVAKVEGATLHSDGSLAANIAFADDASAEIKSVIDGYIADTGIEAPQAVPDDMDVPATAQAAVAGLDSINLNDAGITTVIWCTGFTAHLAWIELPILDDAGHPIHTRGKSRIPGLYFLGFPWLHTRKSGILKGIGEDSSYVADAVQSYLAR